MRLSEKINLCDFVKYFCAICIILGHVSQYTSIAESFNYYFGIGGECVALFLFFSAYGLFFSVKNKNNYLKGFFKHRLSKIVIPLIITYVVTLPIYGILVGEIDWKELVLTIITGGPYLKYSWFVTEIVLLYAIFWFVMKTTLSEKIKIWLLTLIIILLIGIISIRRLPMHYAVSLPGFILGLWYQHYEDFLTRKERIFNCYRLILLIFILGVYVLVRFSDWAGYFEGRIGLMYYIKQITLSIVFIFFVINALSVFSNPKKVNIFIKSSYEVYLIQNCAIILALSIGFNNISIFVSSILFSMVLGFGIYKINGIIGSIFIPRKLIHNPF